MCAKDKRTDIEKKQLGKKSQKTYGGLPTTAPPPPPTAVSPRVEILPIVERLPAGAASVGAWRFNCALK